MEHSHLFTIESISVGKEEDHRNTEGEKQTRRNSCVVIHAVFNPIFLVFGLTLLLEKETNLADFTQY